MKNGTLRDYFLYLGPAFIIPVIFYFFDESIPILVLVKTALLIPLFLLSIKGLTTFFPEENLRERSIARMIEYAALQGMVFAAGMVLFTGLTQPELQLSLFVVARQFAIATLAISISSFMTAKSRQRKLRSS